MAWRNDQVSELETNKIIEIARECLALPGDFVELGCYKGDTSLMLAELLKEHKKQLCGKLVEKYANNSQSDFEKRLWIYDSFEGLPEKTAKDESTLGVDFKKGELTITKREVKERFLRAGLPVPVIKKAWFNELSSEDLPDRIAFSFLDGDFYESIRDSLKLVGPKMVKKGIIVVHDYNNPRLPGVKRAVDEWLTGVEKKTAYQSMLIIELS